MTFSQLCDWIVLIGAVTIAITNIFNFFAKPGKKAKEKREKELKKQIETVIEEKVPELLEKHSKEVAAERTAERAEQLEDIRESILREQKETLEGILKLNIEQSNNINTLLASSKDMLRQRIMDIYHKHKKEKRMPIHVREALDELYKDYKAEKGNSYIDKYYGRMKIWEVYDDEEE